MANTAVSTLVLALEARTNTAAAFAEVRAGLDELVTTTRTAAEQQQSAVRAAAEAQLQAARDSLAQQTVATRDAVAQQVAAVQSGAERSGAVLQAATARADALRAASGVPRAGPATQSGAAAAESAGGLLAARDVAAEQAQAIAGGMDQELASVSAGLDAQLEARRSSGLAALAWEEQLQQVRDQIVARQPVGHSVPISTVAREAFAGDRAAAQAALDELALRGVVAPPIPTAPGFYEVQAGHGTAGPGGTAPPEADIRRELPAPQTGLATQTAAVHAAVVEQVALMHAGGQEQQSTLRATAQASAQIVRSGQDEQRAALAQGGTEESVLLRSSLDEQLAALRSDQAARLDVLRGGAQERLAGLRTELSARREALRAAAEDESAVQRPGLRARLPIVGPALAALAPAASAAAPSAAEETAAIRAATADQLTALRRGAAEHLSVVRSAAADQLAAVKGGLAAQTVAARQATEQQVAAIKAGADQQIAAQRAAYATAGVDPALIDQMTAAVRAGADQQAMAVTQGYEQQVLAARDAANQQTLAVRSALAQQTDEVKANLAAQVDAQKVASAQRVATVRAEAAQEAAAMRAEAAEAAASARESASLGTEHPILSRMPVIGRPLAGLAGKFEGPLETAGTLVGFTAGMAAISAFVEGVHEIPKAFAEAATEGEQFQAQMVSFYGTFQNAGQVLEYTNEQAAKMPFSLESIRSAVAGLSETGQNVEQLLPALGNIASAMHTDLPTAVSVFNRALLTGNMRGLVSQLHLSKTELQEFGLAVTSKGSIVTSTLAPALERLAAARFGDAMQRQSQTAQGGLTRLANAWNLFKEAAGEGLFEGLKGTLTFINQWLATHQAQISAFAAGVGRALSGAASAAIGFARTFGPPILGAINLVVAAWNGLAPAVSAATSAIGGAMSTIGTFLRTNVLPVIEQALGQIVTWWNRNKDQIAAVLNVISAAVSIFVGTLQQNLGGGLSILQGIWNVGWGMISGAFSVLLDVMTGNWKKFGTDLNTIFIAVDVGLLQIFQGLVDKVIQIMGALEPVLTTMLDGIEHALYNLTAGWAGAIYDAFVGVEGFIVSKINAIIGIIDGAIKKVDSAFAPRTLKIAGHVVARTPGLDIPTVDQIGVPTANAQDRANFTNTFSLGWRPDVGLTFGNTTARAQAAFDAQVALWIKQVEASLPNTYGTARTQQATGEGFLAQLDAWLKKYGLHFKPGKGGTQDITFPNLSTDGTGGGTTGTAPSSKDLQAALSAANERFQLLLEKGPVSWSAGMKDIAAIAVAAHNAGQSNTAVTLDVLRDTKELVDKLLSQARTQFDFDAGVAHPSLNKLHQDETTYLAILAKTPGITPLDLAAARQQMDQRITQLSGGGTAAPTVAPYKQVGFDLAAGAGYGQTTVTLGPVRDQLVAHMQQQIAQLRAQNAHAEKQITLLEAELVEQHRASGLLEGIVRNTAGTHEATQQTARHTQPRPTSGAHGFSQRTGVPLPV